MIHNLLTCPAAQIFLCPEGGTNFPESEVRAKEGEAEQILQPGSFIRGGGAGEGTKVDVRGRGHKGPFINDICIIFQDLDPPFRLHFEQPVSTFSNIPPQCGHHLWTVHNRSHSGACVTLLSSSPPLLPPLHNEVAPPFKFVPRL